MLTSQELKIIEDKIAQNPRMGAKTLYEFLKGHFMAPNNISGAMSQARNNESTTFVINPDRAKKPVGHTIQTESDSQRGMNNGRKGS